MKYFCATVCPMSGSITCPGVVTGLIDSPQNEQNSAPSRASRWHLPQIAMGRGSIAEGPRRRATMTGRESQRPLPPVEPLAAVRGDALDALRNTLVRAGYSEEIL